MKILVTGAGGLLGGRLSSLLSRQADVVAGTHVATAPPGLPTAAVDVSDRGSTVSVLETVRPDVVVHCAALADADRCEREPDLAETVNVRACEHLAQESSRRGIRLLAISTDLVFGGERAGMTERDPPRPLMTYARTKLAGEEAVLAGAADAAVLRVALVYGRGHGLKGTASEAIAWSLRSGRVVRLFTDQYRTPVDAESLADAIWRLIDRPLRGRFHLGGPERLSRHEFGLRVARTLGLAQVLIEPVTQAEMPLSAPRPADVSLDSGRAQRELDWTPRPLDEAIRESRPTPDIISKT